MNLAEKIEKAEEIRGKIEDMSQHWEDEITLLLETIEGHRETIRKITKALREKEEKLLAEIREETLALGQSIKGSRLSMVYKKGATRWDSKALTAAADKNPELLKYKTTGNPSVQMRWK